MDEPTDGGRERSLSARSELLSVNPTEDPKLSLFAEELTVGKESAETGRVRVSKQTLTREVAVDEDLLKESAEVEIIPIGRQIFETPAVRHEGETLVLPIVEEVIHIERRLILKEEIRITRRKTTEQFHDRVTLRYQEAVVTRVQSASEAVDNASTKESR